MKLQGASLRKDTQVCGSVLAASREGSPCASCWRAGSSGIRPHRRPAPGHPAHSPRAPLSDRHWEDNALLLSETQTWTWTTNDTSSGRPRSCSRPFFVLFLFLLFFFSAGLCFGSSASGGFSTPKVGRGPPPASRGQGTYQPPENRSTD